MKVVSDVWKRLTGVQMYSMVYSQEWRVLVLKETWNDTTQVRILSIVFESVLLYILFDVTDSMYQVEEFPTF